VAGSVIIPVIGYDRLNDNAEMNMKPIVTSITLVIFLMISSVVSADIYTEAVDNTARSDKDRAVDTRLKPAQVMQFFFKLSPA
jgi:hypothetical protein